MQFKLAILHVFDNFIEIRVQPLIPRFLQELHLLEQLDVGIVLGVQYFLNSSRLGVIADAGIMAIGVDLVQMQLLFAYVSLEQLALVEIGIHLG